MAQLRCCPAVSIILALGWVIEGDSMVLDTDPVASFGLQADDDEALDNDSIVDVDAIGSADRYPARVLGGAHRTVYKTRNSPQQGESCYYPYRSNKPQYCNYYVKFGNYTKGDKRISNKTYKKEPSMSTTPFIVEVDFPYGNDANEYTITYVYVEDTNGSKRIKEDDLVILKGGIGDKFMHLKIESDYVDPDGYRVAIYGKL